MKSGSDGDHFVFSTVTSEANFLGATLLFDNNNDDCNRGSPSKPESVHSLESRPSNLNKHHMWRNTANPNKHTHNRSNSFIRDQYKLEYAFSRRKEKPTGHLQGSNLWLWNKAFQNPHSPRVISEKQMLCQKKPWLRTHQVDLCMCIFIYIMIKTSLHGGHSLSTLKL